MAEPDSSPDSRTVRTQTGSVGATPPLPIARYVELFSPGAWGRRYRDLPAAGVAAERSIRAEFGGEEAARFNRDLLLHLLQVTTSGSALCAYPASVRSLFEREFGRMQDDLARLPAGHFSLGNEPFVKDLAVASARLVPCGNRFLELDSSLPRSLIWRGGGAQAWRLAVIVLTRTGGFAPMFQAHFHSGSAAVFGEEESIANYLRVAELLELHPAVRGLIGSSWYYDPALLQISPRLAHARELPARGGAQFFLAGIDRIGNSGALAKSATRQRLFAEGRYVPKIYCMVWARQDLLRWAAQRRAADPPGGAAQPGGVG